MTDSTSGSVLFVSDVHLSPARPELGALFLAFLRERAPEAASLYILGDLFDYWVGDDDRTNTLHEATLAAIATLAAGGVAVAFMPGNRDFLVGAAAARRARMTILAEPITRVLFGRRVLLMHGDSLCTDDRGYQAYRRVIRNRATRRLLVALPIGTRLRIAQRLHTRSDADKRMKPAAIMDVNAQSVTAAMRAAGADLLIHGHTHRPARHQLAVDGRACERIVLGDWNATGSYLRCTSDGCESIRL